MSYNLYTDGASFISKKKSGWAFILKSPAFMIQKSGVEKGANISKFELLAVINGLKELDGDNCNVTVYTDSESVIGYKRIQSKYVKAITSELRELCSKHNVTFILLGKGKRPLEHYEVHNMAREAVLNGHP